MSKDMPATTVSEIIADFVQALDLSPETSSQLTNYLNVKSDYITSASRHVETKRIVTLVDVACFTSKLVFGSNVIISREDIGASIEKSWYVQKQILPLYIFIRTQRTFFC